MNYSTTEIWLIILIMGIGTFLIRFSFLGMIGDRPMPSFVLRLLRFTPVAVLPGMVAPLVLWPAATDGQTDPVRLLAAGMTVLVSFWTRNALWGILAGAVTFYGAIGVIDLLPMLR
ncbi:AzlD domain-containing protein [Yoonia sp. BS5-3]|uniref:AzlD domain-containing protein n=1 Tax=Yoonia phaeophyticola TaxID=3137369 RepID=A0ABZ2V6Q4_9RHOB